MGCDVCGRRRDGNSQTVFLFNRTVVISCTRDITHNTHAECFVVVVFEDNEVNRPLLDYLLLFLKKIYFVHLVDF